MRPSASSAARHPLDYALGSVARTRVLRALALHGGLIGVPALVNATHVDPVSIRSALRVLEHLGLVETHGGPRSRLYTLNSREPLSGSIRQLFNKETGRWPSLENDLRDAGLKLRPRPLALWLFGSSARHEDDPRSDIDVMLVGNARHLETHLQTLRDEVWKLRSELARRANVTGMTERDLLSLPRRNRRMWDSLSRDTMPLIGKMPDDLLRELRGDKKQVLPVKRLRRVKRAT